MIKMILASNTNGGIGFEGKLPWHIPEDLQYFKSVTDGQTVIMGRKTFESLPFEDGLPNRSNILISSNYYVGKRCLNFKDLTSIKTYITMKEPLLRGDIWVIGGASIYEQLFPYVEEIHHSVIYGDYECDTFVDTDKWIDSEDWKLVETKVLSERATVFIWRKV